jgi:hypothetical protein
VLAALNKYVAFAVMLSLGGCAAQPAGLFETTSKNGARIIGHCVADARATESVAFEARSAELLAGPTEPYSPGLRTLRVIAETHQYRLFEPEQKPRLRYHLVCPLESQDNGCTLTGQYMGGVFEAYVPLADASDLAAAAEASRRACSNLSTAANNSSKPTPLRGAA